LRRERHVRNGSIADSGKSARCPLCARSGRFSVLYSMFQIEHLDHDPKADVYRRQIYRGDAFGSGKSKAENATASNRSA
jgi:hypothetical protein